MACGREGMILAFLEQAESIWARTRKLPLKQPLRDVTRGKELTQFDVLKEGIEEP